jgi:cytochrome c
MRDSNLLVVALLVTMAFGCGRPGSSPVSQTGPAESAADISVQGPERFDFGQPATPTDIEPLDIDVVPDGTGLPHGAGTAAEGAPLYRERCGHCHGFQGQGGLGEPLVGPEPTATAPFGPEYEKWRGDREDVPLTIGNYWPYATTLFDYINRAMPPADPGSLEPDDVYALVAWLLARNGIIREDAVMDRETLPKVLMPARDRFVADDRKGGAEVR